VRERSGEPGGEPRGAGSGDLASRRCVPCRGGTPPLRGEALGALLAQLGGGWRVVDEHHLEKQFRFRDFAGALGFANRIGALADEQSHHPDLLVAWGRLRVTLFTHVIDGLTESDFVLAAKIDRLFEEPAP
jgi:4a-hydroxytetrahydrobiopterin dehydratase